MLTLLLGDGHMTCLAMSELFPLITKRDLQNSSSKLKLASQVRDRTTEKTLGIY